MTSEADGHPGVDARIERHFLLLQMPCGSFGRELYRSLRAAGHDCTRIAINGGDLIGARRQKTVAYTRSIADWPQWLSDYATENKVTDIVCYGDCRPYHRLAIQTLKPLGIRIHVLEEGYLRPNWVTCEADGVNGHSALVEVNLDRVPPQPKLPREVELQATNFRYCFAGFLYYFWTFMLAPVFPRYETHRDLDIVGEATLWLVRLLSWPIRRSRTERALKQIERLKKPVHLALLQLNGDSQIKVHSQFRSTRHFVEYCLAEFKAGGGQESLLVFKNHPLDSGVIDLGAVIRDEAERLGLAGRVFFVETGKLVPLLEKSVSAVAVNSTACHQALLRGIPTLVLGKAVFNHPQIVSRMRLADFFKLRPCKTRDDYDKLVSLMRQTCQFNGSFYSTEGQRVLLPSLLKALTKGQPAVQDFMTVETPVAAQKQAS